MLWVRPTRPWFQRWSTQATQSAQMLLCAGIPARRALRSAAPFLLPQLAALEVPPRSSFLRQCRPPEWRVRRGRRVGVSCKCARAQLRAGAVLASERLKLGNGPMHNVTRLLHTLPYTRISRPPSSYETRVYDGCVARTALTRARVGGAELGRRRVVERESECGGHDGHRIVIREPRLESVKSDTPRIAFPLSPRAARRLAP